ncbi:MAG: hypothetical protein ABIP97_10975, partial [Chthoniobacterales bacterium]
QYTFPGECVTIQSLASNSILVFATAASSASNPSGGESNGQISGYCILTPPNGMYPNWSSSKWNCKSSPDNYGNVDARYNNQAICAFLDGSVRLQSVEELRNMSLWSRNAAMQHNPNYMVPPPVRSGGRL